MDSSISRRRFMSRVGVAGALAVTGPDATGVSAVRSPDPEHVHRQGTNWRVLPNGVDDHDNLEWALRNVPVGGQVTLVPGVYKVGRPIVVPDFDGTLIGAGAALTTITCTDDLNVELWEAPGGGKDQGKPFPPPFPRASVDGAPTGTPPIIFMFYKTPLRPGETPGSRANRIIVRDLRYRGSAYGSPWAFGDETVFLNISNSFDWHAPGRAPATTRQDVTISGVEVDGYRTPLFGPFENACSCITVVGGIVLTSNYDLEGDVDGDAWGPANGGLVALTPAEGYVDIVGCTFRNCRFGPGILGYRDGTLRLMDNRTDGCRANCLQVLDVSNAKLYIRDNDLRCDAFLLPPAMTNGADDVPSSLGCTVVLQGVAAALGFPFNARYVALALDPAAHAAHPEAGPVGTWRPLGPAAVPAPSACWVLDNACQSSETPNTYCVHLADLARVQFGTQTLLGTIQGNRCAGSETCVSLEHIDGGVVQGNDCAGRDFGIELYNATSPRIVGNEIHFPDGVGCDIRLLALGDKIDLSRVVPGAGYCLSE